MFCLNSRAFEILKAEIDRRCQNNPAGQIQREIALKRLEKLCVRKGQPLTIEDLRNTLNDLFPDFNEQVLQRAAKANQPTSPWLKWATVAAIALPSIAGAVWVLNLPYPMIRYPVARTMPMLLLPSFISMDHNYRAAIATTEQADQLVNQATSPADFELGATRVKTAQKHLDALPVWFLGYYPSAYCGWFGCSWRFTLDEFEQARKGVARMDAKLFQEKNAYTTLTQAEQTLNDAKQKYQAAPGMADKQTALAQWQQSMDNLQAIPRETLAGRTAQTKLVAYQRDFQQGAGFTANNVRSGSVIQAAKLAAETAEQFSSKPMQPENVWQEAEKLWQDAIAPLEKIKEDDPDYVPAQKLLQTYKTKLTNVKIRREEEQQSVQAYEAAQRQTQTLLASVDQNAKTLTPTQTGQLQEVVATLKKVRPNTTVYADAQTMLKSAQSKLR